MECITLSIFIKSKYFQASKSNPSQAVTTPFNLQSLAVPSTCNERLSQLVGDIFIGNEMIPQVLDLPPDFPLELTYRYIQTYKFQSRNERFLFDEMTLQNISKGEKIK